MAPDSQSCTTLAGGYDGSVTDMDFLMTKYCEIAAMAYLSLQQAEMPNLSVNVGTRC